MIVGCHSDPIHLVHHPARYFYDQIQSPDPHHGPIQESAMFEIPQFRPWFLMILPIWASTGNGD